MAMTEITHPGTPEEKPENGFRARKPLDIRTLRRLRNQGKSLKEIGKLLGVSPMTVSRQLQAAGDQTAQTPATRARVAQTASRKRWGNPRKFKREKVLKVAGEHPDWPIRLIAEKSGTSYAWAWNVLRAEGIDVPPDKLGRKNTEEE